jgi:microcystin-dependent protein
MSEAFLGEVRIFGGNYAPVNWEFCNGQIMQISTYEALYTLIGTTYGGDGTTTFALPDLRSSLAVSQSASPPPGMSNAYPFGSPGGAVTVTVTEAQIPAHTHVVNASTAAATTTSPANAFFASTTAPAVGYVNNPIATQQFNADPNALSMEGGNQAHPNVMPVLGLSYIICMSGIYPSFS